MITRESSARKSSRGVAHSTSTATHITFTAIHAPPHIHHNPHTYLPSTAPTTPIMPRRTKRSRQSRTANRSGKKASHASPLTPRPPIGFEDPGTGKPGQLGRGCQCACWGSTKCSRENSAAANPKPTLHVAVCLELVLIWVVMLQDDDLPTGVRFAFQNGGTVHEEEKEETAQLNKNIWFT